MLCAVLCAMCYVLCVLCCAALCAVWVLFAPRVACRRGGVLRKATSASASREHEINTRTQSNKHQTTNTTTPTQHQHNTKQHQTTPNNTKQHQTTPNNTKQHQSHQQPIYNAYIQHHQSQSNPNNRTTSLTTMRSPRGRTSSSACGTCTATPRCGSARTSSTPTGGWVGVGCCSDDEGGCG